MLTILPAVDMKNGQAVRLVQGKAGSETSYGDPLDIAREFAATGAEWLHVVDLDAAFGTGSNRGLARQIVDATRIKVELSGGLRDKETVKEALEGGAARVSIGTAALENPSWACELIDAYGDRIAIDLGCQLVGEDWRVTSHGWVHDGGDLWETLELFDEAGCSRFVVTDVTRDGTLTGPNVELLREVAAATDARITASGLSLIHI